MAIALATIEKEAPLSGRQKIAVLCMALGPEAAAMFTQHLSNDEVETISFEIARMPHIPGPTADAVLMEWLETARATETLAEGGVDLAREILERAFGPAKAAQILKRIEAQLEDTAGLSRLRNADPQQLSTTIRGEHPQTIALILAHLNPGHTAQVLKHLDPRLGTDVVYRMAKMEKVSPEMLQMIERTLSAETDLSAVQGMRASGGPAAVAEVLNMIAPTLEKELMEGLAQQDPDLCTEIKNLMFVFEDICALDDRSIQRVLREVDAKVLALALKAASDELKVRITNSMSQRAVAALKEEMEFMGPVKMRDVETAQQGIVAQVRALEEAGEIVVSAGSDDLVIS